MFKNIIFKESSKYITKHQGGIFVEAENMTEYKNQ